MKKTTSGQSSSQSLKIRLLRESSSSSSDRYNLTKYEDLEKFDLQESLLIKYFENFIS